MQFLETEEVPTTLELPILRAVILLIGVVLDETCLGVALLLSLKSMVDFLLLLGVM